MTTYALATNEWSPWTNLASVQSFEQDAGKHAAVVMWYASWAQNSFLPSQASTVAARASIPEITWEPFDVTRGASQPDYSLGSIISGNHDDYVRAFAAGIKSYGGPIRLRFAHEMNGTAYPWSESTNGNRPGQYVAAWRHVHDLFASVGATNVAWIWSPNSGPTSSFAELYPGDSYVDLIGIDGYNGGSALPAWGGWRSFGDIFGPPLDALRSSGIAKPVTISEIASAEPGGNKSDWIGDFFAQLAAHPEIVAFNWFNLNKEADWRIESSASAQAAFAAGVADARYGGP